VGESSHVATGGVRFLQRSRGPAGYPELPGNANHAKNSVTFIHRFRGGAGPARAVTNIGSPAQPGESISLFGTGFGATNPAISDGTLVAAPQAVTTLPAVTIGGAVAQVTYAGLISAGVYQINATVPPALPDGNATVTATAGGVTSASNATIAVQH
jgi:uncharacterized protein (TIGR03437 family)